MSELKPGWTRVKFDDIATCVNDRVEDPSASGVERYVGLDHLDPDCLTIRRWGTPDEVESTKLRFQPGDIIFGKRRAYQRKLAIADFEGICSAHAMVLRAKPKEIHPVFLPFFMQSDVFMNRAKEISVGSLSPTINWKTLAVQEFALPPIEEQLRLLRRLQAGDEAITAYSDAAEVGASSRNALLLSLFSVGTRGEEQRQTELGMLPTSWSVEPLGSRYSIQLGKMMSASARSSAGQVPYLRNANVQWNRLDLDDVATMAFTDTERAKFSLRVGDILSCEGRHVGKSAIWRDEIPGACYQKALHRIRALRDEVPEYLLHCLRYFSLTGRFGALTVETTIPHLPAEKLRAMAFPFPAMEEQREIAAIVGTYDDSLAKLRSRADELSALHRSTLTTVGL
jgi:type I restriction enzyme S subunit